MLKPKLTDDARLWWRMWSVRLAAVGSLAVTYVLASPDILLSTLNAMPPEIRAIFPPFAGFALFALVTIVRLIKQGGKRDG